MQRIASHRLWAVVLAFFGVFALHSAAQAKVRIDVDLTGQRMYVQSSQGTYVWPVSTARSGYATPRGAYSPQRLVRMHYSRKYHMSPMPHSIFYDGGYAIHGTGSVGQLGRPASHGCVRLAPGHAAKLFAMVQREGASIHISGEAPTRVYAETKYKKKVHYASLKRFKKKNYYAARQRRGLDNPYAYAPSRRGEGVQGWQSNPTNWW